ncbi:hypothetical protein [Parapedobacter tibetensis]|uniref:hypothetical protein n=1 Tax=Parapedobacter tibetensis TaxID=2972951 RepID=UPI00214D8D60|nr:hypothetical protein [Parapedobacter tibetensis]
MRTLLFILTCCFTSVSLQAQEIDSAYQKGGYSNVFEPLVIEAGITIPIGNLKRMMNAAPNLGFWYRTQQEHHSILSYGFSVNFPNRKDFAYTNEEYQSHTKSFSGMVGLKLDKVYPISQKRYMDLEWTSVLGYGFYLYDDVREREQYNQWPQWKKDKEEEPAFVKPFSTFHISQGAKLRMRDFGILARYNYAPYAIFSDIIDEKFGAHSITVGIFYRQ